MGTDSSDQTASLLKQFEILSRRIVSFELQANHDNTQLNVYNKMYFVFKVVLHCSDGFFKLVWKWRHHIPLS